MVTALGADIVVDYRTQDPFDALAGMVESAVLEGLGLVPGPKGGA